MSKIFLFIYKKPKDEKLFGYKFPYKRYRISKQAQKLKVFKYEKVFKNEKSLENCKTMN